MEECTVRVPLEGLTGKGFTKRGFWGCVSLSGWVWFGYMHSTEWGSNGSHWKLQSREVTEWGLCFGKITMVALWWMKRQRGGWMGDWKGGCSNSPAMLSEIV
jgi:hypothetical protein